jgi:enoyl-CoA hydratase/carnithine racemase
VQVRVDDPVVHVTLARPEVRNAQTPQMWRALAQIGQSLPDTTRVVVLRGQGPSFSAGLDRAIFADGLPGAPSLTDLAGQPRADVDRQIAQFQEGFTWWRRCPAITIAAVHGHAVGAGFQLALACDLVLVADDAMLAMRETTLGLVPDLAGTHPLVRAVGYSRALELCATGRWVGAREAVDLGLALAMIPAADLAEATDDLVAAILAAPDGAVRATKQLLAHAVDATAPAQQQAERTAQYDRLRALGGGSEPA